MTQTITLETTGKALFVALELSAATWKLAISSGGKIRVVTIDAMDLQALVKEIDKARTRVGTTDVVTCYEAGADGHWIQRFLTSQGIFCYEVDPSSIQVNRRARRKKTDKIDAVKLCIQLMRWHAGDEDALHVCVVPSVDEEDIRRRERDLKRLKVERGSHSARIKSLLFAHGVRLPRDRRVNANLSLDGLTQWDGTPLPPHLVAGVQFELQQLALIEKQIRTIEGDRRTEIKEQTKPAQKVATLMQLKGIAEGSAWTLALEAFAWRTFENRRQVASYVGLDPTPFNSGDGEREQGISKSGNKRIRALMCELSWGWLQFQPDSALSKWFNRRFAQGGPRMRRIGITAMARKLLVALWRWVDQGVLPDGAMLKTR
jgi:transposase